MPRIWLPAPTPPRPSPASRRRRNLMDLPNELLELISSFLPKPDIATFLRVNRTLYTVVSYYLYRRVVRNGYSGSVLHWVARRGTLSTIERLVEAGASLDALDSKPGTKMYPPKEPTPGLDKLTLLHTAAAYGHPPIVHFLLSRGADPNAKATVRWFLRKRRSATPLQLLASADVCGEYTTGHEAAVRLLISYGADPNAVDNAGIVALDYAAKQGSEWLVRLLLDAGAHVRYSTGTKATLHHAVERCTPGMLQRLLLLTRACDHDTERDIKPVLRADVLASLLMLAVVSLSVEKTALLLRFGADPNDECEGTTPLMRAVLLAPTAGRHLVDLLLARGGDLDVSGRPDGSTVLDVLIEKQNGEASRLRPAIAAMGWLLLSKGARCTRYADPEKCLLSVSGAWKDGFWINIDPRNVVDMSYYFGVTIEVHPTPRNH